MTWWVLGSAADSVAIDGVTWWVAPCSDLAKFSVTPDPPIRLQVKTGLTEVRLGGATSLTVVRLKLRYG